MRNHGPDDITTADTIVFRIDFGLNLLRVADIPAGGLYLDTFMQFNNNLTETEEQNLCIFYLPDRHIGFADSVQTNDSAGVQFLALGPNSIAKTPQAILLSVYPNPVGGHLQVALPHPVKAGELQVWDIAGKQVFASPLESNLPELRLPVAQLRSGIYFLSIISERGSYRAKFVKQ